MKHYFVFFFFCLGLNIQFIYAQNNDIWRAGSAYSLKNKTYILSIFISTNEKKWTCHERKQLYQLQYEAENWISAQAKNYGADISFERGNFGFNEEINLDYIQSGSGSSHERVDWVSFLLKKVGYSNPLEFYRWVKKNTSCTNALVIVYANQDGIGYAMPFSDEMNEENYFVEGCVLFRYYDDGRKLCAGSIAHEILHIFGAWDLYETYAQTKDRERKAEKIFPDDIMLKVTYHLEDLKIDKLTAWLVGLNPKEESYFEWFRPKDIPKDYQSRY